MLGVLIIIGSLFVLLAGLVCLVAVLVADSAQRGLME
jgi:hypothetical protein